MLAFRHALWVSALTLCAAAATPAFALPVSGAVVWFDAQDVDGDGDISNNPLTGTNVATWVDKAGSVQGTQSASGGIGQQPVVTNSYQNGQATLTFSSDVLGTTIPLSLGTFTYFTTLRQDVGQPAGIILERSITENSFPGEYFVAGTGQTMAVNRGGPHSHKDQSGAWAQHATNLIAAANVFGGTHASHSMYINGVVPTLSPIVIGDPGLGSVSDNLYIGARAGGAGPFNGDIAEVIAFGSALNSAQINVMNNYTSSRYSIALAANDFYDGDTGANGDYDFELVGIGREADGSNATSSGAGLTIAESGGSLAVGEYVLAAHKTPVNGETNGIWDRVWYLDKTATDGVDATLTFDYSDSGLPLPSLNPDDILTLLYSATDPFSFSSLAVTASVSGDQVSFTVPDALLLDGYYTLQLLSVPEPGTWSLLTIGALGLAWRTKRRK